MKECLPTYLGMRLVACDLTLYCGSLMVQVAWEESNWRFGQDMCCASLRLDNDKLGNGVEGNALAYGNMHTGMRANLRNLHGEDCGNWGCDDCDERVHFSGRLLLSKLVRAEFGDEKDTKNNEKGNE